VAFRPCSNCARPVKVKRDLNHCWECDRAYKGALRRETWDSGTDQKAEEALATIRTRRALG
jgi:ribosomal protein L37AE/L43A